MIEKSARMGKSAIAGTFKARKRKADEITGHYPGVPHYPFAYQQDQHYSGVHTGYYQDDGVSQSYYNPRPYFPYVDPGVGPSTQASSLQRCQVLPYPHRTHTLSPSIHANNYHGSVITPPTANYPHHGYHVSHQAVIPHSSQPVLPGHPAIAETIFDPHY